MATTTTNIVTIAMMAVMAATLVDCVGAFQTLSRQPFKVSQEYYDAAGVLSCQPIPFASRAPRKKLHLLATDSCEPDIADDSHLTSRHGRLESKTWMFRNKYPIAYEVACSHDVDDIDSDDVELVPMLLLNGFGVGSFHQHSLMRQILLLEQNELGQQSQQLQHRRKQGYIIYGIDYLGQGRSWPENCDDGKSKDELNLAYSADTWLDQLKGFIEEVALVPLASEKKVHLVGNSVGGYLATILAHRHPHLIASLTLMNATPVWGLNLPGWDGKLPAPSLPKLVGRVGFDTIRDADVTNKYLEAAYVHREAFDGTHDDGFNGRSDQKGDQKPNSRGLGEKIRACTEGEGGHAAFASIMWSAPASNLVDGATPADFYGALRNLPVDVLLLFGSGDAWCTPAVAKRMHITLDGRDGGIGDAPAQRYISLENVGHCPNHEAPTAVARVLLSWIGASSSSLSRRVVPLVSTESARIKEQWGDVRLREVSIEESRALGIMDRIVSTMVG